MALRIAGRRPWVGARVLLAVSTLALVAQIGLSPSLAQAQSPPAWLAALNKVRTAAGLSAVTEDTAASAGAIKHSRYVVLNQTLTHEEDPTKPGYTSDGDAAGRHGDVAGGAPDFQQAIEGYMTSAFHWEPILDPGLESVGYGAATYQDVGMTAAQAGYLSAANTLVFTRHYAQATRAIMWPPSGGAMPYTSYPGGEMPDVLFNCPGYSTPTGASISVQLPSAPQVSSVTLTQSGISGTLSTCWVTGGTVKFSSADQGWARNATDILTYANAVLIMPQAPLTTGTYCVSIRNTATPAATLAQWSFSVGGSTAPAPAPCASSSAPTPTPVPTVPASTATGTLAAGQQLNAGDQLLAPNGKTRLVMQLDGNLVLYRTDTGAAIWSSGTFGKAATHVAMQPDGNFVLYNNNNSIAYWSSGTYGHGGAKLVLRDDGNLVIVDANGAILWQSNTAWNTQAPAPTPTPVPASQAQLVANQQLTAGQVLTSANGKTRLAMQTDGNLVLYRTDNGVPIWSSNTYGKPAHHVLMQTDGNFVLYNNTNSIPYWSSGTYGHGGSKLVLRDDGNLVVVDSSGGQLWASGTHVS